jgi:ParB family chromosome partitioning protein
MEISLIENIQREDLNPIEEAMAYQRLVQEFGMTQEALAQKLSKSRTLITNMIRLLKLNPKVQEMLIEGEINTGHAKTLLGIEDMEQQYEAAQKIVTEGLTVREVEELVRAVKEGTLQKKVQKTKEEEKLLVYHNMEENLKNIMGTKVHIKNKKNNKGKIEIEYYSVDDLERIIDLLNHISE